MDAHPTQDSPQGQDIANALKGWVMAALTMVFVILYGAALTGWLKPLDEEKMVARLEPIIFVIIGYYFGRLPAQQNEQTLKDEIGRQTQKADAAQHAKERAQQTREALEEKVKNVRAALAPVAPAVSAKGLDKANAPTDEISRGSVAAAINILNS